MQTNYLKYFVDVAKLGSIAAASNEDFITPQGMSRSLSALESSLGCQLFMERPCSMMRRSCCAFSSA